MRSRPTNCIVAFLLLVVASQHVFALALASPADDPPPTFSMSKTKIRVGTSKDVEITISKGDLSDYAPQLPPESSGITFEKSGDKLFKLANNNRTMIIRVTADEEAETGIVKIVIEKSDGSDVRSFDLEVTNRFNAGPTPEDIKEVDAMWKVIPYEIAKINFGRRVADNFYAIQVYIGNNSGFDLQIVGVGFNNILGVDHVDQYGRPLQIAVDEKNNPLLDEHGNKLVRVLDKNGKQVTVDGKTNGPPVYRPLKTFHLPTTDHRLVRGSIEFEQLYGRRAFTINLIAGIGTFMSGFIPFFHALGPKANFSTFSSIVNGHLKEGFGIAAPDLTVGQLNRLEDVVLREGLTILNNRSEKTIVFFPKRIVGLTDAEKKTVDKEGMYPLMNKLGELIIVGKPLISFRNREIVVRRPGEPDLQRPPTVPEPRGSVSPARTEPNGDLVVRITGSNLLSVTDVRFGSLTGTIRQASRTESQMDVVVPANAQTGEVTITRTNGSPNNVGSIRLPARVVNVSAAFAKVGDDITIEGANLAEVAAVTIGGDPVSIKSRKAGELVITVLEGTHSGPIKLKHPPELQFGDVTVEDPREVIMQPVITAIQPPRGGIGTKVTLTGYNFSGLSEVKFGDVVATTVQMNPTRTTISAVVPEGATSGPVSVKTVNDLVGKSSDIFTFVPRPAPEFPASAVAGQDLTITGTNLADVTGIKIGNAVIPLSAIKENTPTKITFTIPVGTASGTIIITTAGGDTPSSQEVTITPPS